MKNLFSLKNNEQRKRGKAQQILQQIERPRQNSRSGARYGMGYIYLYTGTGAGITANALGLALRSIGHKHRLIIIQFLKLWKNTGEYKVQRFLAAYYEIYQFGRKGWVGLGNLNDEDRELAQEALRFAEKITREKKPHLLILDEINLALYCQLLDPQDVIKFLDRIPKETDVVLTGRYASKELVERADFVNEVKDTKAPKETVTTKGIQY